MLRSHAAGGMARARPTRRRLSGSEDLAVRRPLGWPEETPGGKLFCRCVCVCYMFTRVMGSRRKGT